MDWMRVKRCAAHERRQDCSPLVAFITSAKPHYLRHFHRCGSRINLIYSGKIEKELCVGCFCLDEHNLIHKHIYLCIVPITIAAFFIGVHTNAECRAFFNWTNECHFMILLSCSFFLCSVWIRPHQMNCNSVWVHANTQCAAFLGEKNTMPFKWHNAQDDRYGVGIVNNGQMAEQWAKETVRAQPSVARVPCQLNDI